MRCFKLVPTNEGNANPTKITFGTTGSIVYIYNALGQKVEKQVFTSNQGSVPVIHYYLNGFQYVFRENYADYVTKLQFVPTAEGYYDYVNAKYVFNYTDHLGNIRLSYAKNPTTNVLEIIEESNYYPFGLKHKGYNGNNSQLGYKYKYNGKELQDELGLNVTAMDYRQYDSAIGRFYSPDVLSELTYSITPYRFAYNNPIYFSDPTGLFETRREAREYRREHHIKGGISRDNDGSFSINDTKNNVSYFKPGVGIELSTTGSDGVTASAMVTTNNSSNSSFFKEGFSLWGGNLFGDLGGWKNGTTAHSINTDEIPIMGGGARSVRGANPFEKFFSILKNLWDLWDKGENIEKVSKSGQTPTTLESQNTEPVTPPAKSIEAIPIVQQIKQDTTSYILNYWKNGIPQGGSGAGEGAGLKGARKAAGKEMRENKLGLDSISVTPRN